MRHVLEHATASSARSLLRDLHRQPLLSYGQAQWTTSVWICQRCYHHNLRVGESKKGTKQRTFPELRFRLSRLAELRRAFFSTSLRKLESKEPNNESNKLRNDLPSQEEGRRSHLSRRLSHVMDHLQSNIFIAGQRLNDLTGYSGIEALKKDIEQQGRPFRTIAALF